MLQIFERLFLLWHSIKTSVILHCFHLSSFFFNANNLTRFKEEVMALPLSGIEALLASDDLRVVCEDVVYYTVLKWVRQHYDGQKERQEVVGTRLARLIRFP